MPEAVEGDLVERAARCEPTHQEHAAWHQTLFGKATAEEQRATAQLLGRVLSVKTFAMDEIERLRAALSRAEAERERFQAVCQQIVDKYDDVNLGHEDFRVGAFAAALDAFDGPGLSRTP